MLKYIIALDVLAQQHGIIASGNCNRNMNLLSPKRCS